MKYVIIGNSAAAIGCVEGIRQADKDGKITIITNEAHHTYSRPLISYYLLGKTDRERMKYRKDSFYDDNGCELKLKTTVTRIDSKKKTVTTDKGETVSYDKLLVSTGSSPFVPPISGLDTVKDKFTFMTLDDAEALKKNVHKDSKVLILGAGLIGLKCAEGLSAITKDITVVDLADKVLSSILDDEGSKIVKEHLLQQGFKFYLSDSIEKTDKNKAFLKSGTILDFDVLVLAVGVRPNISLLADIGGKIGRGIVVNNKMETSIKDIYAAGDCTESFDISSHQQRILALLPNAYMQGETAGKNMAGEETSFNKAIPMNAIGFNGLHMTTAGTYTGDTYLEHENGTYKKLFYSDNHLNGYIIIGDVKKAGIYTSLIREQKPLDEIDFDLICKEPGLMAFSKDYRQHELGGEH